MIRQFHLSECDSTQDVLKEQLTKFSSSEKILVSCDNQIAGRGRGENKWSPLPGGLFFSFNIEAHPVMSYTAIELAVILADFFESKGYPLKLKWPNDLWNSELKKCGGILVQGSQHVFMAGIGLNLFSNNPDYGGIMNDEIQIYKKEFSLEIVAFIHANRIQDVKELRRKWLQRCGHLNSIVKIVEGDETFDGVFQGLGDFGEALVCQNGETKKIFNGSLRIV